MLNVKIRKNSMCAYSLKAIVKIAIASESLSM